MKKFLAACLLALSFGVASATTIPVTFNPSGDASGGYNCGRVSSPVYCYGLPVAFAGAPSGSQWLDVYTQGTNSGHGFIVWNGEASTILNEGIINGISFVGGNSMPSSLTVSVSGETVGGQPYTGVVTYTFTYYHSNGGGGRGGAGSGYRFICTNVTGSVTY